MEPPEGICGFELRPEDVGIALEEEFPETWGTACCWRESWQDGRCVWHAEVDKKSREELAKARRDEWDQNSALAGTHLTPREQLDGAYLPGADLSECGLHGCRLINAHLSDANLQGADLSEVDLQWAELSDTNLADACLSTANLKGANFSGANFKGADLSDAVLRRADLLYADLRRANLSDANLKDADLSDATLRVADLSGANLEDADLSDTDLLVSDMSNATLRRADLSDAFLRKTNLTDADLEDADLSDTDLLLSDMSKAVLRRADLSDTNMKKANMSAAVLKGANLSNANIRDGDLADADLQGANLPDANLSGANMPEVDLSETTLQGLLLDNSNIRGINLSDATIDYCSFEGADLTGAECDETTFRANYLYGARLQNVHFSDRTTFEAPPGDWCDADQVDNDAEDHHLRNPKPSIFERIRQGARRTKALYRMEEPETDEDGVTHIEKARNAYRERERLYRENSLTDRVGDAYMGAKRAQHREALAAGNWLRYAWLWLQKWTMGYGERPWRLVGASVLGIALFGVLYPIVGQIDLTDGPENLIGAGYLSAAAGLVPDAVASAPLVETLAHWGAVLLTSLYFSTVTFTTLGYGDIQPHGAAAKTLAGIESFAGAVVLALFVAVLARVMMR